MTVKTARCTIEGYGRQRHIQDLLNKACENDVYAIDSNMSGIGYAYEDGYIAIISTTGWMKMPIASCEVMAKELQDIIEDIKDIKKTKNHEF